MAQSVTPTSRSIDRPDDESLPLDPDALPPGDTTSPVRQRILLAGLRLFGNRGYHGTSIRDVAAVAGLQSASLYSHFAAKEAILAELVFIGHDAHHQALLSALIEANSDPRDQLRDLMAVHVAIHCQYSDLAIVSNYERRHLSPQSYAPAAALRERSSQLVVEIAARGVEQHVFDIPDLPATLAALGSLGIGVTNWYPQDSGGRTPDEVGAAYADLALRMVAASEPR